MEYLPSHWACSNGGEVIKESPTQVDGNNVDASRLEKT
jgi:hypothetical protein